MKCPSFERLIDYLDGRLAVADAARVAAHLEAGCAECAADREWYVRVREVTATDDSVAPPPWVLKRAVKIFETRRRPRLVERLREAVATLIFDSFAQPALEGVRSTATASRQLLYRAGEYSIDLQVQPLDLRRAALFGQMLREGELAFQSVANLPVTLLIQGQPAHSTTTNDTGEFRFADLETGEYELRVETPTGPVHVARLPINES